MIATKVVYQAWRNDKNRYTANPRGEGYLTRDMRWREVMRYCRKKDAERPSVRERLARVIHDSWSIEPFDR